VGNKPRIPEKRATRFLNLFAIEKSQCLALRLLQRILFMLGQSRYDFYPNLDLVPAQFELDDTEIELASTTMGAATVSEWQKRTLLPEWLDAVKAEDNYDYIVFDCPPATKLVSQNALAASDYFVIPVIPDVMSSRGVYAFRRLVSEKIDIKLEFLKKGAGIAAKDTPKSFVPATKLAAIVPYMAKHAGRAASGLTNIHTEQLAALRRLWGADMTKTVVKHMTGVPKQWMRVGQYGQHTRLKTLRR
jgi:chromosome partitioning protein